MLSCHVHNLINYSLNVFDNSCVRQRIKSSFLKVIFVNRGAKCLGESVTTVCQLNTAKWHQEYLNKRNNIQFKQIVFENVWAPVLGSLTLSQWSSSGNQVAIQCAWHLDPSVHWNATGERILVASVLPVVFQWLSSGLPVCSNYVN